MNSWVFEVFFDGDCPLCLREIKLLRKMDRKNRIVFTDIADKSFSADSIGKSMDDLMARIHGRLPNGTMIEGVDVFRHLYSAVGLSPIVAITKLPGITQVLDLGYVWFAKNRLKLTGRCKDDSCSVDTSQKTVS